MNMRFTGRSIRPCFCAAMSKPYHLTGALVAAFAAPVLFAAPANALPVRGAIEKLEQRLEDEAYAEPVHYRPDRRHDNRWNQTPREVHRLTGQAIYQCEREISREARRIGYRTVEISDRRHVTQTGPYRFQLGFRDVSFRTGRHQVRARVRCDVVRGTVTHLEGIPWPVRPVGPPPRYYY